MAVTIWGGLAIYSDLLVLRDGSEASVAVVKTSSDTNAPVNLHFKRLTDSGGWPPDTDALLIQAAAYKPVALLELPDGALEITNGATIVKTSRDGGKTWQ